MARRRKRNLPVRLRYEWDEQEGVKRVRNRPYKLATCPFCLRQYPVGTLHQH